MPRTMLLTTTAFACLVLALGCERDLKAPNPPRNTAERTTTILARPPVQRVDPAPKAAEPEPATTVPPVENAVDTPALAPKPAPPPAVPHGPPSPYRDGCGRPLVA